VKWSPTKHRKCAELTQKPAESKLCIGATEWKNSSLLAVNLVDLLAELDNIEQGDGIILVLPARNCDKVKQKLSNSNQLSMEAKSQNVLHFRTAKILCCCV